MMTTDPGLALFLITGSGMRNVTMLRTLLPRMMITRLLIASPGYLILVRSLTLRKSCVTMSHHHPHQDVLLPLDVLHLWGESAELMSTLRESTREGVTDVIF